MARYEKTEGSSRSFWELELKGDTLSVRHGLVGTQGQGKSSRFPTAEEAKAIHDTLVSFKESQGYVEVPTASPTLDPGIEQMLLDDPSDTATWAVYGDFLQSKGDIRGEIVCAAARGAPTAGLIKKHAANLMGPFAPHGELHGLARFEWHMGYWRSANVLVTGTPGMKAAVDQITMALREILAHPSARFLQELRLGISHKPRVRSDNGWDADWQEALDTLVSFGVRPTLHTLVLGDSPGARESGGDPWISWTVGRFHSVWSVLPALQHLTVQGRGISFGTIAAPQLRSLAVWSGELGEEPIASIGNASLPELLRLELAFGERRRLTTDGLLPVLARRNLPSLRALAIINSPLGDRLPGALAASPLLPGLTALDLSLGNMTDAGAAELLANAAAFRHLALDLRRNFLSTPMVQRIQARFPRANATGQRILRRARGEDRYEGVME